MRLSMVVVVAAFAAAGCTVGAGESNTPAPQTQSANSPGAESAAPALATSHATHANLASGTETSSPSAALADTPDARETSAAHHVKDDLTAPAVDPVRAVEPSRAAAEAPRMMTIPAGTALELELLSAVSSNGSHVEDAVQARLQRPLVVDGITVLPAGAAVSGHVTEATRSARVKGRARVGVRFTALRAEGTRYDIRTAAITREAAGTKKDDAKKIAIGAGAGAVIGAIAGGKKGAAIGTGVGAGGGTATVLATRGDEVSLPRGAHLSARLASPLTVRID